jgi:multiple sugar transport system substrate-binding protein
MDKKLWWLAVAAAVAFAAFFIVRAIPPRPVTVVFSQWWSGELPDETLESIARDYEKENAGIKIKIESSSRAEVMSFLKEKPAESKRKKTVDIVSIESAWPEIFSDALAQDQAFTLISFIKPLFYNIALLEKAGFDRPPKNRTEFLSYAQSVSGNGVSGAALALEGGAAGELFPWILSGGNIAGDDGVFDFTAKANIDTLDFVNQLKPWLAPDPFTMTADAKLKLFAEGKIAMMIAPVSCVKRFKTIDDLRFGITTVPPPASYIGKPAFDFSYWAVAVCAESRHPEEAAAFVQYLLSRSSEIAAGAFAVPGSGSRAGTLAQTDDYYAKAFEMYESADNAARLPILSPKNDVFIYDELKALFAGKTTPEEAAKSIQHNSELKN